MRNWRVPVTFTLSLDGVVTSWSEGVKAVLGYGPDDFLGQRFDILFTADDVSSGVPERLLHTAMSEGSAPLAGWRLDRDGVKRFARGELTALHGADEEIVGLAVVFLPTSAGPRSDGRKGQAKPMKAIEQFDPDRLAELLTGLEERFYILDEEFNFVYVNHHAEESWGMSREDLVGQGIVDVFPQLQDTEMLGEHLKVANEGVASRIDTDSILTGKRVEVSIYPNLTGGVSVLVRDPFDRNEQFRSMLDDDRLTEAYAALEIAVLEWEPESGSWQESLTTPDIFGLPQGARLGNREAQLDLVLPTDVDRYDRAVNKAVAAGNTWRTEYRIVRPNDGEVAWIEEYGAPVEGDGPQRYSVLAWDVTSAKLAEERLRSSQRRLQQELASNRRLQEVMSRTASADDPQEALAEVLSGVMELFAVHQGTLRALSREEGILRIVAQRWFDGDYVEKNAEFAVDPVALDERFGHINAKRLKAVVGEPGRFAQDDMEDGGYKERWVPLVGLNGQVVGFLALHWRRPWTFSDRDEHDLFMLARQAAGLVQAYLNDQRSQELLEDLRARMTAHGNELIESEIRFRRAFEVGPVAACITTVEEDRFLEVNSGYVKLTGYAPGDVVGRTSRELGMWSSSQDQARLEAAFKSGGEFREVQLRLRTNDGHVRDILLSGQQITYDGKLCWLKMFNDVTDQHRSQEELMAAIREVMSDTAWFGQSVVQKLAEIRGGTNQDQAEFDLTARERQVLELVAVGLDDEEIGEHLGISQKTVRNHLSNTYAKTGVHSRAEAIVWARDRGMVARV